MNNDSNIVVVGIGNEFRRDDGVGLYVSRLIREKSRNEFSIVDGVPDGFALIETWDDSSHAIVIDCAASKNSPGTIYRFDALREKIPGEIFNGFSTHSISIVDAIKLAGTLNRLPKSLIVFGLEGKDYSPGNELSPEVKIAADKLAEQILNELK
jgi:hydrogenase maturation protease